MSEQAKSRPIDYDRAVKLGGAISRFKGMYRTEKERADAAERRVQELTASNTELQSRADGSIASRRVEELTGELRAIKHKAAFDKLATGRGAKPDALDDLWQLSGYKPEADLVDEATLGLLIDDQKARRSYLFGEPKAAEGDTETPPPPPPPKPGAGSGQGGANTGPQKFTDDQMNDPAFVMANYDRVVAASQERVAAGRV